MQVGSLNVLSITSFGWLSRVLTAYEPKSGLGKVLEVIWSMAKMVDNLALGFRFVFGRTLSMIQ